MGVVGAADPAEGRHLTSLDGAEIDVMNVINN